MDHDPTNSVPHNEPQPDIPEHLGVVGRYSQFREANEHALVILSMKLPYWMFVEDGIYYLCAEQEELEAIHSQLSKYKKESRFWPPKTVPLPPVKKSSNRVLFGYCLALIFIFLTQVKHPDFLETRGAMHSTAFFSGDYWRAITALTLHGDLAHLSSNLLALFCFGWVVNRTFGTGPGWLLILLSGLTGNTITAWVHEATHHSLGASTAIFGALGMLIGHAVITRFSPNLNSGFKYRIIPLLAGFAFLGIWGAGDARTDVLAHVFGFLAGIVFGAIGTLVLQKHTPSETANQILLLISPAIILLAWWAAF